MATRTEAARALAITVVLAVNAWWALPLRSGLDAEDLERPEVIEELTSWEQTLGVAPLGPPLVRLGATSRALDAAVRAPFVPVFRFFGLNQSWAMFATPDAWPQRLEIHVRENGDWRSIYDRWDRHAWMQPVLRQRRVRGLYDAIPDGGNTTWWNFTRWIAREALLANPDADAVRVRMIRTHTTLPGHPVDPATSVHLERVHRRTAVLPEDDLGW